MQDTDGIAVGCEDLGEALVAVGRFVEAAATQDYVSALQPALHHLRLDEAFALDHSGLAVDDTRRFITLTIVQIMIGYPSVRLKVLVDDQSPHSCR